MTHSSTEIRSAPDNKRHAAHLAFLGVFLLVALPLASIDTATAVPSRSCGRSNVGATATADGVRWICHRGGTSRVPRYRWQLLRLVGLSAATTTTTRPLRGTPSGAPGVAGLDDAASEACLLQGTGFWENADPAYWQNVLNQKVNGNTNQFLRVRSARKGINFLPDGVLVFASEFLMESIDARSGITASNNSLFRGRFHVEGSDIVIDSVEEDNGTIVQTAGGVSLPPRATPGISGLVVGYRMFFKCEGNLLGMQEPGLTGNAATTYTRQA